ncbi:Transcriptional regulator, MarR family [Thermobacillus xylanilyticus]|uniref:Transcriptional regulator, MarR family n=1 Tax=Thermobacillus xylanilyticus TaxID=76633 RepID=A0ABM8V3T5_THEXY|nr:MarR family transcriptional regulator [Thermobacillus xylanilyticus]CAG5085844.1 Transcriptional regulator, MarR family [Thermobacillus xylanilyticus]
MKREAGDGQMDQDLLASIIKRYEEATYRMHRRVNILLRRCIGDEDITLDQYLVIRYLRMKGRSISSELADVFGVGKSSITAIMTRLSDKRLIERIPDVKDRRVIYLSLTEAGRKLAEMIDDRIRERLSTVMNQFSREEALQFVGTYEKVAEVLADMEGRGRATI